MLATPKGMLHFSYGFSFQRKLHITSRLNHGLIVEKPPICAYLNCLLTIFLSKFEMLYGICCYKAQLIAICLHPPQKVWY